MFSRWYNQQIADRATRRDEETHNAEMLDRGQAAQFKQREADRADLESKAQVAGAQAEMLGEPAPTPQSPEMQLGVQQGTQGSRIESILASRAAAKAEKLQRLKDMGAIDQATLGLGAAEERERMGNLSAQQVARGNNATAIRVAEINAGRPSMMASSRTEMAANTAGDMRATIAAIRALRPNGDFSDFLTKPAQGGQWLRDMGQMWGVGQGADPEYKRFQDLTGALNIETVHKYFGGALTPQEAARADRAIVNINMSPTHYKESLDVLDELSARVENRRRRNVQSSSVSFGGSAATPFNAAEAIARLRHGEPQADAPVIQSTAGVPRYKLPDGRIFEVDGDVQAFLADHPDATEQP